MATNIHTFSASTASQLREYFREHNINNGNVVNIMQNHSKGFTAFFVLPAADIDAPTISCALIPNLQTSGSFVDVYASLSMWSEATAFVIYYRTTGGGGYIGPIAMSHLGGGLYKQSIPEHVVTPPSVDWYLEATDGVNVSNCGTAGAPNVFTVV